MARFVPVILLALVLVGCGTTSSNQGSSADCKPLSGASRTPHLSPALEQRETMFLTDVSVEGDECSDRVVFDFKKGDPGPGFEVSYKPESVAKIEDGSGLPLSVAGAAFLVVRLTPAMTAEISGEKVTPTYTGPRSITPPEAGFVREVVKTGDFENVVTWVIGLDSRRPFTTDASESQLVVEIANS
jgi:hypothetical protein